MRIIGICAALFIGGLIALNIITGKLDVHDSIAMLSPWRAVVNESIQLNTGDGMTWKTYGSTALRYSIASESAVDVVISGSDGAAFCREQQIIRVQTRVCVVPPGPVTVLVQDSRRGQVAGLLADILTGNAKAATSANRVNVRIEAQ